MVPTAFFPSHQPALCAQHPPPASISFLRAHLFPSYLPHTFLTLNTFHHTHSAEHFSAGHFFSGHFLSLILFILLIHVKPLHILTGPIFWMDNKSLERVPEKSPRHPTTPRRQKIKKKNKKEKKGIYEGEILPRMRGQERIHRPKKVQILFLEQQGEESTRSDLRVCFACFWEMSCYTVQADF